jgi:hypothetical protein
VIPQEDNHKRVVRQIRNTNPKDSKVNPDKFQDVQDNEKSDRSELTTLKVESDSEKPYFCMLYHKASLTLPHTFLGFLYYFVSFG